MGDNTFNDEYLKKAAKKANLNVDDLKKAAKNGTVGDFIDKKLSPDASKKLKSVLSDKSATEKLLSTPEAKKLFEKLTNGK